MSRTTLSMKTRGKRVSPNSQSWKRIDTECPTSSGSFCATDTSSSELLLEVEGTTLPGASETTSFDGSES